MDLAWRGIRVIVAELRHRGEAPPVKCNHVAARSMEVFRRLGVAGALRDAGLPPDYPNDVAYRITATGEELARIPIPCRRDRFAATGGPDTWWPTAEPPHRINQLFLEPILFRHAEAMPGLTILHRTRVLDFAQGPRGVVARAESLDDGAPIEIACDYLVGCDGGTSASRRQIGAAFQGDAVVSRVQSTLIRAPALIRMFKAPPAWGTFSLNPRRAGNMYAIDGRELWLIHNYLRPEEPDFDSVDRDACIRAILGVGPEFDYAVVSREDWFGRRLVADRLRDRRAFICGDAAHIWVPMAGYGMNAGIADAANLSWMLAAVLQGWAPEGLLAAHEAERLPITGQVSRHAMNHELALAAQRRAVPAGIEDPGPEGDAVRARVGRDAYELNVNQYCCGGLNFGYFYDASPVIAHDGEAPPPYSMYHFTPSTVPGCRLPFLWLKDGRGLYDALDPWFTLIRRDHAADAAPLLEAARARGVPMALLDLDADEGPSLYDRALVLARPDGHVAWRGDAPPADPPALVDLIRGAAPAR
jgi:2-polyprenyl-6-methoxyphenol hydroxylase-like FAD-dependent oxidoreductase